VPICAPGSSTLPRVPIHVTIPGSPGDPREAVAVPAGVLLHHCPPLHPDDVDIVDGVPVTSPSRTLIDLAEELEAAGLTACFERAQARGLLDPVALRGGPGKSGVAALARRRRPAHRGVLSLIRRT